MKSKRKTIWFILTAIFMTIYLAWRIFFTLPLDDGLPQLIFGLLLIIGEVVTVFTTYELLYRKIKNDNTTWEKPEIELNDYCDIDVFIATHNESCDLLYKTVNACTYMEYPDKNKVHIYICDDGEREEVETLAKQLDVGYLGVKDNKEAKSGNYNYALENTQSPLIATFDADMIPQHTFLMETVPYFFLPFYKKVEGKWVKREEDEIDPDYRIGLVQTPQSFYNVDLFQYNLYAENHVPNEQDFFSREVNCMRNSSNAIAYTGSNTVIARQAMVDIGGFPTKTITEDFESSCRIQKEGYKTYATDKVQAAGLSTTTIQGMMKQRTRWARGVIQSIQNTNAIFTSKLPLGANLTYLNAFLYWWSFFSRIIFILAPIMFALFDFRVVDTTFEELLIFWLPGWLFYSLSMRYLSGNLRNQRWSQVIDTILAPYLIIPVFLETFGIHERKFKVTSKKKTKKKENKLLLCFPYLVLIVLSVAALIRFVRGKYGWALVYSSIIIFWIGYNLISLIYAVFFVLGRKVLRNEDRIAAKVDAELKYDQLKITGKTVDFSDSGLAIQLNQTCYIPEDKEIEIELKDRNYVTHLKGNVVHVKENEEGMKVAFKVEPIEEKDKREYFQIIYDRNHSLPVEMDLWSTAYDELVRNVMQRIQKLTPSRRTTIRYDINKDVIFADGSTGKLIDFNYKYFTVLNLKTDNHSDIYELQMQDYQIRLKRTHQTLQRNKSIELFEVINKDELQNFNKLNQICEDLKTI